MEQTVMSLLNVGAVGAVLVWVLWRIEPRLERIERSLNRLTRAQMLTLLARHDVDEPVREQAREVLREIGSIEDNEYGEPIVVRRQRRGID